MQEYGNDKLFVRHDPAICIHAGECVRGLPSVFSLSRTPWIDVNGASVAAVISKKPRLPPSGLLLCLLGRDLRSQAPPFRETISALGAKLKNE